MSKSRSLLLSHPDLLNHGYASHPENSSRLEAILQAFASSRHADLLNCSLTREATKEELYAAHQQAYVDHILALNGKEASIDMETFLTPGSVHAASLAAGLGLELVESVITGKNSNGFAFLRPPGHHATHATGMGFCLFNNIAIAVKKALTMGVQRILILDWDVHHGNGTQDIFYADKNLLLIDLHQEDLFPIGSGSMDQIGRGDGYGYTVNVPLPKGCKDSDYLYVFDHLVKPIALRYRPELILVSAGFDAHESDPLAFMELTQIGYRQLTAKIKALAEQCCEGRLGLFLEGGYVPYCLAQNALECVDVLVNPEGSWIAEEKLGLPMPETIERVDQIYAIHENIHKQTAS